MLDLDPEVRIATRIFGPGAEPLPGFGNVLRAALAELGERERTVFLQRLAGKTLEEVGKELGLTRERVRQIEARALRRLRGRVVRYIIITKEELPPPALSVDDIEKLLVQASRDQREAWREFRNTFSPEQSALWRRYWNICSKIRRGGGGANARVLAWREFTSSLSAEQRALWRAYRRASAYTRKVRAALRRAREGKKVYVV
jgi:DNA-binding CsgD family transcriptional regulator